MDDGYLTRQAEIYLRLWEDFRKRANDDGTALGLFQEFKKDQRLRRLEEERALTRQGGPASHRQRDLLKRLGVKARTSLSRHSASELIDEALAEDSRHVYYVEPKLPDAPRRIP